MHVYNQEEPENLRRALECAFTKRSNSDKYQVGVVCFSENVKHD